MPDASPDETEVIFYTFSRDKVEAGDFSHLLKSFDISTMEPKRLASLMGRMAFFVEGYDERSEEIYAIPEVRSFYQKLHREWPYWFFFCNLETDGLLMMTLCCLSNVTAASSPSWESSASTVDPRELLVFISDGFNPMNEVFERAGMSAKENYERTNAIFRYFNLPSDKPFNPEGDARG